MNSGMRSGIVRNLCGIRNRDQYTQNRQPWQRNREPDNYRIDRGFQLNSCLSGTHAPHGYLTGDSLHPVFSPGPPPPWFHLSAWER
jgi:hypothetical protein